MNRHAPNARLRPLLLALALAAIAVICAGPVAFAAPARQAGPARASAAYEKDVVVIRFAEQGPSQADLTAFEDKYKLAPPTGTEMIDTWRFKILDGADPKARAQAVRAEKFVDWAGTTDDPIPTRVNPYLPIFLGGIALLVAAITLVAFGPARLRSWIPGGRPSERELERLRGKADHSERRLSHAAQRKSTESKPATRRR